jgi:hypothetical protein
MLLYNINSYINCLSYATAQAIKDSKILQTYGAKNKREMKMGPGTELNVSASCNAS